IQLLLLVLLLDDGAGPPGQRHRFVRERRSWYTYVKPMLEDGTFRKRFRMDYTEFTALADILCPKLERDQQEGERHGGAVDVEFQLAMTLRFLAGGSVFEVMDSNVIGKSTAYAIVHRVVDAINQSRELECSWPQGEDAARQCLVYEQRSTNGVIKRCVGAMDGLFVRLVQPSLRRHANPGSFYSGHKKGFGLNFQVCLSWTFANQITAWTMNCPGSQNDRTAFKHSGFDNLIDTLPDGCFIVGDAAYPPSHRVLVPYPGTAISRSQDAYNF
ncbi:unnamed protein product, partial [Pylaiella littoralis]